MKSAVEAQSVWALMLAVVALLPAARGVWLNMPSSGWKCVYEELQTNAVVLGDYYSFYGDGDHNYTIHPTLTVKVSSPHGSTLYEKKKSGYGQFAFTANEPGTYASCFTVDNDDHTGNTVSVGLEWKIGVATKDWDSVAKKEKIEGLDLEMKKLQDYVQAIKDNMIRLMSKDLGIRYASVQTNARVAHYSQASLGLCIVVSALQLWYLRRYFRKKKLI
ncbi:transmembrane emp24 domain-containing protein p24delta4-like [Salvia divinorum]|uniref:Transmembrane emp24 domain-containing protein p24delta4-like n=1 Tax=Salvia divinorum TaxID=28513 RepID=A0ABD1HXN7_SALDI